jgi:hypothetical protein
MLLLAGVLLAAPHARADVLTYPLTTCQISKGCGSSTSFGTVTVSSLSSNEVSVTLTLGSNDVFAFGGAGQPLLFNVANDPAISVSNLTSNLTNTFAFYNAPMTMADGTGKWDYFISCSSCGTGTSMSTTGPGGAPVSLSFDVMLTGITPESFTQSTKGFTFASDIGIPNGSGGFMTGDVGATTPLPLPPSIILLGSAVLAGAALMRRHPPAAVAGL